MVKGVNKTVIEINNTGSKYFDRVILFVNPSYISAPQSRLESKAAELIRAAEEGRKPPRRRRRKRNKARLLLSLAILCAAALTVFLLVK